VQTLIIYRDSDDYYPNVRTWLGDFARNHPDKIIEEYSPDDPKVDDLIRIHDLNQFPAIAALDDNGKIVARWVGTVLPRLADVAYYSADKLTKPGSAEFDIHNSHVTITPPTSD